MSDAKLVPDKPFTPFEFATAASHTKEDLFGKYEIYDKDYSAFMVNKAFSLYDDTILYANEMNLWWDIPPQAHFNYYRGSVRAAKRFSKWPKMPSREDLKLVRDHYNCSNKEAAEYLEILTKENLQEMRDRLSKGGVQNGKKPATK